MEKKTTSSWVDAIEQQILSSLQANDAGKSKKANNSDQAGIQAIRCARGNNACADCSSPSPDWASINLGALVCIECSGIHRNLGTHISRVRSLDLDEWPNDIVKVMVSIGNSTVNSVWEANTKGRPRPTQSSLRDEKERWIRSKYEAKEFLPPLPYIDIPVNQQLIDALVREDIRNIIVILGHAEPDDINAPYSKDDGRTALHIAAALGNVVFVQLLLWSIVSGHHHHGNKARMMSQGQMYSIIDDNEEDDNDSSDMKEVMPCPPYMSPVGYGGSTPRHLQSDGLDVPIKIERDLYMNFDTGQSAVGGASFGAAAASSGASVRLREASEYTYAQALLKQAPKLTGSGDLDGSSVLRLARAYITLQQGLKSWENSGNKTKWWPDYLDGGKLTLAAQETMNCFVLIMTSSGQIVYISDAVESLLGHDQINLVGRRIQNVVPPDELPVLDAQFALSIGPSGRPTVQRSFYTRMLNVKSVSQQQRYELVHMIGHLQDVSISSAQPGGGVQRETWLMCACKVMAPHIEEEGHHAPVKEWISHNALDGKILYMDPKSCQVTGYLPQEMVGRSTYCFIHHDDLEHVVFSHNQALINVGGSSCTYRMYRRSNDVVYVHTTTQLARDKLSNKPTFLFCINHIMDEAEGKLQISRHQQNLMSVKEDPSTKYSMNDIEKTVKALEVEGGNSPPVMSKGGMKPSKLTDSCSADGGDLLRVDLPSLLRFPPLFVKAEKDQWAGASSCYSQSSVKPQYSSGGQYQQSAGQVWGYPGGFDGSPGEQQTLYGRSSQQHVYSNQYQQLANSASLCQSMISTTSPGDSPVSGAGSYMDYLNDSAASPSVPPDGSTFNSDALLSPSMLASPGRARGRGRTRGRPRGSGGGRGSRGTTRGVRGTRGPRSRGGRGRGRGSNAAQLSQMGDLIGGMKKSDSLISCGAMSPLGNISPMGSTSDLFSSHNSNMGLQRSNSSLSHQSMSGVEFQRMSSDGDISSSGLQRMNTDDSMMFQRMPSTLDDIEFALSRASSDDMISSRSWAQDCTPSAQVPPYRTVSGSEHVVPEKKVGRPRGSRNHDRHKNIQRGQSVEDTSHLSLAGYNTSGQQSSVYNQDANMASQNAQTSYNAHSPRGGGGAGNNSFYHHSQSAGTTRGHDNFQRTMSLQNHSLGHLGADMQDPEHSILGNLLKGRGDSTSSAGNKSPAHTVLMNVGRSADHFLGPDRGGKSPAAQPVALDRGGRSPAHSFISDVASPASVFSPDPSRTTPSIIKDEPDLLSPYGESSSVSSTTLMINPNLIQNLQQSEEYLPLDQGQQKTLSEMQMFSSQLRQKHHSLAQSLANQEIMLHQIESKMQQVAKDLSPESVYSQLNARLNIIKSDKAKQEKELQLIQARLEEQLRQQQPRQQQQIDLQRHRLGSPAPTNTRRMAIVPPIQRQPTEGDLSTNFSQHDMKSAVSQQDSLLDDGAKPVLALSPQNADNSSKPSSFPNHLHSGKMGAGGSSAVSSTQNLLHQPTQPSPFSLHHHHHHHHHYHHHPLLQPTSRVPPHGDFAGSLKGSSTQPPPPYSSFDSSVFSSAVAPAALSISVSTSNTSPIICDTSPVSVDESPGCGSDASSGYHSLSLGADSAGGPAAAQYNKAHCLDMPTSTLPSYNSKPNNPSFGQSHHNAGKSTDFIPGSGQSHNKSPPT